MKELYNPKRRKEKAEMQELGLKSKKAYRKWQKAARRVENLQKTMAERERMNEKSG
jgi:exoribonuclease R